MLKPFILYCLSILTILYTGFSSQHPLWEIIPSPTNKDLRNCFFIDKEKGWMSGDSGIIIHTSDSGKSWIIQNTGITKEIKSLFFINERLGWAVALQNNFDTIPYPGTIILKTTDGGNNWTNYMYPDTNVFMNAVYFLDSLHGFIGGAPKFIYYTHDGGLSWEQARLDSAVFEGLPVETITFYDSQTGYASGGTRDFAGSVWTTTDGGLTWKQSIIGIDPVTDLYIVTPDSLFGTGGDYKFGSNYFTTSDFGRTWKIHALGFAGFATAIDFRTSTEGWITLGASEMFCHTLDGGVNWKMTKTPESTAIFDIVFIDSLIGWAAGNNGVILKYNSTMVSSNSNQPGFVPEGFRLQQNYPNPFNPKTIINYQLSMFNYITLKVYDNLGREVVTLINADQNAGEYSIEFDGSNLPSGIYFYELKADSFSEIRRMVLLK